MPVFKTVHVSGKGVYISVARITVKMKQNRHMYEKISGNNNIFKEQ